MEENPKTLQKPKNLSTPHLLPFFRIAELFPNTIFITSKLRKGQIKQLLQISLFSAPGHKAGNKALFTFCKRYPRNFGSLKRLTFEALYSNAIQAHNQMHVSKCFQSARSLQSLELTGSLLTQAKPIIPFIKNLKQIQQLTLNFNRFYWNGKSSFSTEKLLRRLKRLNKLEDLKIDLSGPVLGARHQIIEDLSSGMSRLKLPNLKSLYLNFSNSTLECDQLAQDFCLNLRTWSKSLSEITLNFHKAQGINDLLFKNFILDLQQIPRLEKLELILSSARLITEWGLQCLFLYLSATKLKSLKLDFANNPQTWIQHVFDVVSEMSRLENLSLKFSDSPLNSENLKYLKIIGLGNLKSLSSLSLTLSGFETLFDIEEYLANGGGKSLKKLILNLSNCKKILNDDEKLVRFGDLLSGMRELETFGLDLSSGCYEITDKGMNDFLGKMEDCEKLQRLSISFGNCNEIQGSMREDVFKNLEKLEDLEIVILNLSLCSNLNKENFEKSLPKTESLKYKLIIT